MELTTNNYVERHLLYTDKVWWMPEISVNNLPNFNDVRVAFMWDGALTETSTVLIEPE